MNPSQPVSYNSAPSSGGRKPSVIIVILAVLLIGCLIFGGWAYSQMQSYKNDTTQRITKALAAAKTAQTKQVQDELDKTNTKQFVGSPTFGTVSFSYPKTWSAYVDTTAQTEPINGYFYPNIVPGIQSGTAFALRVELLGTDYSQILQQFQSRIKTGAIKAQAYLPPKLKSVANAQPGTLLTGSINNSASQPQNGSLLVIKVRDKTLEISTQSNDYFSDFNNVVLTSLTFAP